MEVRDGRWDFFVGENGALVVAPPPGQGGEPSRAGVLHPPKTPPRPSRLFPPSCGQSKNMMEKKITSALPQSLAARKSHRQKIALTPRTRRPLRAKQRRERAMQCKGASRRK